MSYRRTDELKPGTSLIAHSGAGAYVLLRHEKNGVVWLNLETAAEEPMKSGNVDEATWRIVEP